MLYRVVYFAEAFIFVSKPRAVGC